MKYCCLINKFLVGILLILGSGGYVYSQGTSSPYSSFGVGLINNTQQAAFNSMGNVRIANMDSVLLNVANPASFAFIAQYMPIVNLGITQTFSRHETTIAKKEQYNFTFNNITMGFKMGRRFGMAFGLLPYSLVGYDIVAKSSFQDTELVNRFTGKGGLYSVFIGFAGRILDQRRHKISLGINGKYLFGRNESIRTLEFDTDLDNYYNSKVSNSLRINGFSGDIGLQYQGRFNDAFAINLGLVYTIGGRLKAHDDVFSYTFAYIGSVLRVEQLIDTVEYEEDVKGKVTIPHILRAGINFEFKDTNIAHKNKYRFLIGVDFDYEPWSNYKQVFSDVVSGNNLQDYYRLAVGFQYTPHYIWYDKSPNINYFARVHYRLGFQYGRTGIQTSGSNIDQLELTGGFGFPLAIKQSSASINIGVGLGQRGTLDNNLVKESYVGIYFGLSLSPGVNNLWFRKRKYD